MQINNTSIFVLKLFVAINLQNVILKYLFYGEQILPSNKNFYLKEFFFPILK